ncbi:MAG: aldo/keto reductase [Anaerolineae bacterium]|nr:aldo/keto reductase [Anaerolineae bacterium]
MEYRYLGRSGIRVSALSLGSWVTFHNQVNVADAVNMMAAAYDAGVNFFDNAEAYAKGKSEEIMGAALKKLGWRRSSYLISTKFFWGVNEGINEKDTLNRKYLLEAIDGSLKRFGLDHVDLVYCHRPDPNTPIGETVWAMHNIVESGKAFYWGTSEWPAADILAAIEIAERHHLHKPLMEQPQYNLLHRERFEVEYARLFKDYGYGSTTWSPLASGLLTGKYNQGIPAGTRATLPGYEWLKDRVADTAKMEKVTRLQKVADELGVPLAQMAIAWILKNPNVSTVITGASKLEQVKENMKAMEVVAQMTPDVMESIRIVLEG